MPDEEPAKPDDPGSDAEATRHLSTQPTAADVPSSMPTRIGRYHIKRVIGAGGMGTVYQAVQEHPRRTVAVKILQRGIASRSALRRFEFESQILARLRHPAIAQVYEAGTHDEGGGSAPYFVMEYIPSARPITEYARAQAGALGGVAIVVADVRSSERPLPHPDGRSLPGGYGHAAGLDSVLRGGSVRGAQLG